MSSFRLLNLKDRLCLWFGLLGLLGDLAWPALLFATYLPIASAQDICPVRPTAFAAGDDHSLVLKSDGSVWGFGRNHHGQLGDGTIADRNTPGRVSGLNGVVAITCGSSFNVALRSDGTVWSWGANDFGQLGDGTMTERHLPARIASLNQAVAITSGNTHSFARKSDGTVWAWGLNHRGQLGDGTLTDRPSPVPVSDLSGVIDLAAGFEFSLALKADGSVWAFGRNDLGQLGFLGSGGPFSSVPRQIDGLSQVIAVAAGWRHGVALTTSRVVWTWGDNFSGQLGNGEWICGSDPIPNRVAGLSDVTALAAGGSHNLVRKADGSVWAWGANFAGQLGDGTILNRNIPVPVNGLGQRFILACGGHHSLAAAPNGLAWSWGRNTFGQLGDGTLSDRHSPGEVILADKWVEFTYVGAEFGAFDTPYNTLMEGINAIPACGVLAIKSGVTTLNFPLTKAMSIHAYGGPVTLAR